MEKEIIEYNDLTTPLKYQILLSPFDVATKAAILHKVDQYYEMDQRDNEYHKLSSWVNGFSKIPFNNYIKMPVTKDDKLFDISRFLNNSYKILENTLYGQENAKNKLMQILAKWISNPVSDGNVIALEGPPGVGKTSLIKNGVSKALNRPFCFMSMGGATDASNLEGHNYTYEGACWGRVIGFLMESGCMNPIIFFDELDKISTSDKGQEIVGILTHLTDSSQNNSFKDNYFSGIEIDLSKALFIFSYNNPNLLNPILKDRLTVVKFDSYDTSDKIKICKDYLLKDIYHSVGLCNNDISISNETIRFIINKYASEEKGVRSIKRCLEDIIMKINLLRYTNTSDNIIKMGYKLNNFKLPVNITKEIAEQLLNTSFTKNNISKSTKLL